mgnify:FL=1
MDTVKYATWGTSGTAHVFPDEATAEAMAETFRKEDEEFEEEDKWTYQVCVLGSGWGIRVTDHGEFLGWL